ncbi:MAG TPA: PhoH family protein [Polyangia bacterium]|jgi:PhoH-like ATPase|nr:PhoH family protein [Polyangia bacterium]
MRKNYILDTNVLLHDPLALFRFEDNTVIIPIYVLEEIDSFKKELSERGRNARQVARELDRCRSSGHLAEGVTLETGGRIRVALGYRELPAALRASTMTDNLILAVALEVRDQESDIPAIVITKDVNLRIRADALGLQAEDYESSKIDIQELYTGQAEVDVTRAQIDALYSEGALPLVAFEPPAAPAGAAGLAGFAGTDRIEGRPREPRPRYYANQFIHLRDRENPSRAALSRVDAAQERVQLVRKLREGVFGIRPRNKEQHYALDLLLDDEIKLVTLVGKAGTGKTLMAIAAGLHKVAEEGIYQKLLVARPIFPLGRDIGYLPGDVEEKLNPWMQPIHDAVELLLGFSKAEKKQGRTSQELLDLGYVQIEPLTYIRGRSIPHQFMVIDEAQNLTPHEVKTILTRVGEHTKIVLTGDPYQIDNPYVDSASSGLTTVVERFKGEAIAGHVTLFKGERSPLAELAANML